MDTIDRRSSGKDRKNQETEERPAPASVTGDTRAILSPEADAAEAEAASAPSDFLQLVHMLFIQTMITLGEIPNPSTGKAEIDLRISKSQIGFLEMLEEKTKGNLTETESKHLAECLHQAHLTFVMVSKTAKGAKA